MRGGRRDDQLRHWDFADIGVGPSERLSDLARRTLYAASLLEKDLAGKVKFATGELLFKINDRLAATNTDATFAALKGELEALAKQLYAGPVELARVGGPKDLFTVRIAQGLNTGSSKSAVRTFCARNSIGSSSRSTACCTRAAP